MTDERDEIDSWLDGMNDQSAPTPDPRFLRELRAGLIAQAERMTPKMATNLHSLAAQTGRWLDRRTMLHLAAVLAIVFAWAGTLAGGGPREITDRFAGYFQQDEAEEAITSSMYRGNIARTGVIEDAGPAEHPYVAWEVTPAEPGFNIVNATDDIILLAYEAGGRLVALDRADGVERWKYDSKCQIVETTPAIVDGVIYLAVSCRGDLASSVIALNEVDGHEIWRSDFQDEVRTSPLIVDDTLYAMTTDYPPALVAINVSDGALLWQQVIERVDQPGVTLSEERRFGSAAAFSPSYGDGLVYVASFDGLVHGVNAETGEVQWSFDTGGNSVSTPAFADGTIYISFAGITMAAGEFGVLALDAESGSKIWEAELPTHIPYGGPLIYGDVVIYPLVNGPSHLNSVAWSRATGERVWGAGFGGSSMIANGVIYLIDQQLGNIAAIEAESGDYLWSGLTFNTMLSAMNNGGAPIQAQPIVQGGSFITSLQATSVLVIESRPIPADGFASPTPEAVFDFTGLPACVPPPGIEWQSLEGEPEFTLAPTHPQAKYGQPDAMSQADIPEGAPVSETVLAELEASITAMTDCSSRPGQYDASGFFSEDYFRRVWVRARLEMDAGIGRTTLLGTYNALFENETTTTFELPDGRIARLTMNLSVVEGVGSLYIFVPNGDRWVIDEVIEISNTPEAVG